MRSQKRKAILVLLDFVQRNHPSLHGMTLLAIRAELALVDVGVAIRTLRSHIGKYRLGMTLGAGNALVQTAERKLGLVMIELRNAANRFPSSRGVAILARKVQIAVRTSGVRVTLRLTHGW